jgi:hypothetical protein
MKSRRQMEDELQVVSKDADRLREEVRTAQKALSRAENRRAELVMMLAPKMTCIVRVSDHALIRYLERKFNMDIESIRAEILTPDRIAAIKAGAKQIAANGIKFVVKDQTVTTVTD